MCPRMSPLAAVVLCAGKGTRMKSEQAKLLHPLLGRPLFVYPIARALELGASPMVAVVGHQAEAMTAAIQAQFPDRGLRFARQGEQRGTGHAVQCAQRELEGFDGDVLILNGDAPLLRLETLQALQDAYRKSKAKLAILTTTPEDPTGYGRVVRKKGSVARVVEQKDASKAELKIREVNAGVYIAQASFLWDALGRLQADNAQGELYLTDVISMAAKKGRVASARAGFAQAAGANDRAELASVARAMQRRINLRHMRNGVSLADPHSAYIADDVVLAPDVEIGPMVSLVSCTVERGARIEQGCVLSRTRVGEGAHLKPYTVSDDAEIGPGCKVGPFAHLRPGTRLAQDVHIGNFVETKKARIGKGSKANHLSYLGDAEVGAGVNVGAGTITCNYDGKDKHVTRIGDRVFIGSDTQLIAPVSVGDGAYIGAGTTVTDDVPPMSLALSRVPQVIKEGWVARKKSG
jgi:bifunctional UDP-N-acetylglucosamine pyrophosphorylase/glucosamine-1-phosphate N-acetyltransferase